MQISLCYFPCIILYFYYLSIDPSSDAIFVLSGTKNDITGHIVFMKKARVCDN